MTMERKITVLVSVVSLLTAAATFIDPLFTLIGGVVFIIALIVMFVHARMNEKRLKKSLSTLGLASASKKTLDDLVAECRKIKEDIKVANEVTPELHERFEKCYKCILDIDRVLLYLAHYKMRIKLAELVKGIIKDWSECQYRILLVDILLDRIGWSYVLAGNYKKATLAINEGIKIAQDAIGGLASSNCPNKERHLANLHLRIVRGKRHLCSMLETEDYQKDWQELSIAEDLMIKHHDLLLKLEDTEDKSMVKILIMRIGLSYGLALSKIAELEQTTENSLCIAKTAFAKLNECDTFLAQLDQLSPNKKLDEHRRVKIQLLRNKIYLFVKQQGNRELQDFFQHLINRPQLVSDAIETNNCLRGAIENITFDALNETKDFFASNIYIDEAMIYYLDQRIQIIKSPQEGVNYE